MKTITKKAYGKNIKITDARDNFSLAINNAYGNTEQDTTSGKNLLDCSGLTTQTVNGVTFTPVYDDKGCLQYVNANGTATANIDYWLARNPELPEGDLILSCCPIGGNASTYMVQYSNNTDKAYNDVGSGVAIEQFDYETYPTCQVKIRIFSGVTVSNLKFYPMIRLATIADGTYEPFTNGASPNPDYPQEIKSVILSEIKTCKNQLFNKDNPTLNATINNGVVSENEQYRIYAIPVKIGESYKLTKPSMSYCFGGFYNEIPSVGVTLTDRVNLAASTDATITATDSYFCLIFGKDEDLSNVMFNLGTVALPYEPYTESVATLSNPITLNGLNGVQDYADEKRGVEHHKLKEITLTSSMPWYSASDKYPVFFTRIYDRANKVAPSLFMSNKLSYKGNAQTEDLGYAASFHKSAGYHTYFYVQVPAEVVAIGDADAFKTWIDSNDIKLLYELAEPIETPLPEADLEALKSLKTYDGVTHIFTDSVEVEPTLEVEYTLLEAKNDWNYTDYILHTDYNRIVGNINYLKAYLDGLFIGLTNISTMEEKTAKSLIYAREINAIETALEQLNLETYKFDIGDTKEYMANTRTLNFEDLNRIESAIFMLAEQMTSHKENLTRLAFTLGNQKGIRV